MRKLNSKVVASFAFFGLTSLALAQADWANNLPDFYHRTFMNVELWQWLGLVAAILIGGCCSFVGSAVVQLILKARSRVSSRGYPKTTRQSALRAGAFLAFAYATGVVESQLGLDSHPERIARSLVDILVISGIIAAFCAAWDVIAAELLHRSTNSKSTEKLLIPVIYKLVRGVVIVTGGIFIVADVFNVNVAALFASLGLGGVVVALAAKDSIENIFGSITILFDRPFAIGDWVKTNGVEGTVEEINLRSTRIRTFEDTVVNLPNANLIRATVENYSVRRSRRQKLILRLSYGNSAEKIGQFCDELRAMILKIPEVANSKTVVELNSLDETSIGVLLQTTLEADDYQTEMALRRRMLMASLKIGHGLGIQFINPPLLYVPDAPGAAEETSSASKGEPPIN